ncbi:MAG: ABC transporter ATP-binding protein [Erysipelothrix sp.]|nr:ABC transporter ATP-binding protein [Erysipelothrix sp.]
MLKVYNLSKKFRNVQALKDITLEFENNRIYGLLGRNGAGKSTLVKAIGNRIFSNTGFIEISDNYNSKNSELLDLVHIMSQEENYDLNMKVINYFEFIASVNNRFDIDLAKDYARQFELNTDIKLTNLSLGYRTIFKLCIALAQNTPFIIYDEPVFGLDLIHRELFYKLLLEQYSRGNITIIIATHIIDEIENLIDRVIIIDHGQITLNMDYGDLLKEVFLLSGNRDVILKLVDPESIIYEENLGTLTNAYVKGPELDGSLDKVQISHLELNEIFIALTSERND